MIKTTPAAIVRPPVGPAVCPECLREPCTCTRAAATGTKPKSQREPIRVSYRRTHKGSGITLIERLPMHPAGKEELLKSLKKRLGVGGTCKQGILELQGDHRTMVKKELEAIGFKVRVPG